MQKSARTFVTKSSMHLVNFLRSESLVSRPVTIVLVMVTVVVGVGIMTAANDNEFILLKSGKVLEGSISTGRKGTRIDFPTGDYILVPSLRIEKSFESKRDLVNYKTAVTPLSSQEQSRLLDWLLEQEAYDMAETQLTECQKANLRIDIGDWTKRIANQRDSAIKASTSRRSRVGSTEYVATSRYDTKAGFTRNVQQHFVMGCGLSGCHNAVSKTPFKLYSSLGKPLDHEQTSKNYSSASQYLQSAEKAELLQKMVTTPHGRLTAAVYPRPSQPYLAITTWINATRNAMPRKSVSHSTGTSTAPSNSKSSSYAKSSSKTLPKSLPTLSPAKTSQVSKSSNSSRMPSAKSTSENTPSPFESTGSFSQFSTDVESLFKDFNPRDEFDPEIFNRIQKEKSAAMVKSDSAPALREKMDSSNQVPSRLISPESSRSRN